MNLMIIGSGGRESALCWKLSQSENVEKIFIAPGVGYSYPKSENIGIGVADFEDLAKFAKKNSVDLTVVGPEVPLVLGIADKFEAEGLKIFGPKKKEAFLEGSKKFAKEFMLRYNIPTALYKSYTDAEKALKEIDDFGYPLVVKADGLCAGKGVLICKTRSEASDAIKEILVEGKFGEGGKEIVIEEFIDGVEASLMCLVSHNKIFPMESAKDFKRIGENDTGLNTGGVACLSPAPVFNDELSGKIMNEIIRPIEKGLRLERMDFTGVLFIGLMVEDNNLMVEDNNPKVLEFNVRFGDPETEVVLPRLESDLCGLFLKALDGSLKADDMKWSREETLAVLLTSGGYPESYEKSYKISGLDEVGEDVIVFHNGTLKKEDGFYTAGGRVLTVLAKAESQKIAGERVYNSLKKIDFLKKQYRNDILNYI